VWAAWSEGVLLQDDDDYTVIKTKAETVTFDCGAKDWTIPAIGNRGHGCSQDTPLHPGWVESGVKSKDVDIQVSDFGIK
jgi:hypothetical protein